VYFCGFWVLELPLAWGLAVGMRLGPQGAFLSVVIAECAIALASVVLFKRGRWAGQKI
jgi:Na+-driven multidrug efflux pump